MGPYHITRICKMMRKTSKLERKNYVSSQRQDRLMTLRLFTSPGTEKKDQSDCDAILFNDDDDNETGASIFLIMREI